jgi:ribonuclease T
MAQAAGITWDSKAAHSAAYDAEQTAEIFCGIVNSFKPIYDGRKPVSSISDNDESNDENDN